jgi:hypothetical protein
MGHCRGFCSLAKNLAKSLSFVQPQVVHSCRNLSIVDAWTRCIRYDTRKHFFKLYYYIYHKKNCYMMYKYI